jgi:hypothetical protein
VRYSFLLFLLLTLVLVPLTAEGADIRVERPNLVGGELGGRGIIYSMGFERYFSNNFGLGAGLMGIAVSEGGVGLFPLYASIPLGNIHNFYLGGGITLASGTNWDEVNTSIFGTASIGYMYHSTGGFWVRPTINALFIEDNFLALPGIAMGGSF